MGTAVNPATFTVTVFTRHAPECSQKANPQWKRCNCRKSLYIYENNKVTYKSAKTRSWEQAEKFAQQERDLRDPVKLELAKIAAKQEEEKRIEAERAASRITIVDALNRWLASHKRQAVNSLRVYKGMTKRIHEWSKLEGFKYLSDVTPNSLDKWCGEWAPDAELKLNRMGQTSQSIFVARLRGFFAWAFKLDLIDRNPAKALAPIPPSDIKTMPLTQEQFKNLLEVTAKHPNGNALKAVFLLMRWTGLRIGDVLEIRKSDIIKHRVVLVTQKTGAHVDMSVPREVVQALDSLPAEGIRKGYYFWESRLNQESLHVVWVKRVTQLRKHLSLKDEHGNPMEFRSHMLRDTFAVELLLAGVTLDKVSKLLTHKTTAMTERYYAPWVKARKAQLDDEMRAAMRKMGATFAGD
jgi:integrase/recombinase XerD